MVLGFYRILFGVESWNSARAISTPVKLIDIESALWEKYGMTRLVEQIYVTS